MVLSIDEHGTILTANERVYSVLGFEPEELIGQDIKLISTKVQNTDAPSCFINLPAGLAWCSENGLQTNVFAIKMANVLPVKLICRNALCTINN